MCSGFFEDKSLKLTSQSPASLLSVGISPDDFTSRFGLATSDIKTDIQADMVSEDTLLAQYIETAQLEKWYQGVYDQAKKDVEEEVNAETERGLLMDEVAEQLEEVERRIAEEARAGAVKRLKGRAKYRPRESARGGGCRSSLRIGPA